MRGDGSGPGAGLDEDPAVLHDMIGGEDADQRRLAAREAELGCDRRGGMRATPGGFGHDFGAQAERLQLVGDKEALLRIVTTIGLSKTASSDSSRSVRWKVESRPNSGMNCFGIVARALGHRPAPCPVHITTGMIFGDIARAPRGGC